MMTRIGYFLLCILSVFRDVTGVQFHDHSFAELTKLAQELEGPFASVQTADMLWGHDTLVSSTSLLRKE